MFLTITTTGAGATDLGYLLHKHPDRAQAFDLPVGRAHVFYPEAGEQRCTAALLLEVDPVGMVRNRRFGGSDQGGFSLAQYVNDRPYAASSMLAVALGQVFRSALAGRCTARPELPDATRPLAIHLPALPCRGGRPVATRLFEPLGWQVDAASVPLDPAIDPALGWGDSRYLDLHLTGRLRLADALRQLYVLLPVLDDAKHYWVSTDEVDKLVRAGEGWLAAHPERALITARYLRHQRRLVESATERLTALDDTLPDDPPEPPPNEQLEDDGSSPPRPTDGSAPVTTPPRADPPLGEQRAQAVLAALRRVGASSVLDLGCGEGRLLRLLVQDGSVHRILGVDVSARSLEIAARRLRLDQLPEHAQARIALRQSSLTYRDAELAGFDAAVLMEVIEHLDPPRLPALERTVFGSARPRAVLVTTPNAEHNVRYGLAPGQVRHPDHRFEWTRVQFRDWADRVAREHGYTVQFEPVGPDDPQVGPPTQLAVFTLRSTPVQSTPIERGMGV